MYDLNNTCFLCRTVGATTYEHVFPKWLQRKYSLWNQQIVLANGTTIKYRELTVPCCRECNNEYLSRIETRVGTLIEAGDVDGLKAGADDAFIWLYKIMYGINYKEMFLPDDRSNPNSGTIVTPESLAERDSYTIFPLFARNSVVFDGFVPYSFFTFKIDSNGRSMYHFVSEPYKMYAAILLDNVGIVVSFQDDGYIARDVQAANVLQGASVLTPAQFGDFAAYILFLKARMKILPNYLVTGDGKKYTFRIQEELPGPLYRAEKAEILFKYMRRMFAPLFEDHIVTEEDGSRSIIYSSPFVYF